MPVPPGANQVSVAVVVPSNRPDSLERWQREWKEEFDREKVKVYVVRDEPETWRQIRRDLGEADWIIPVKTDCIRSYGFWQAWRDGAETIVTLDDDCYPWGMPVSQHQYWLSKDGFDDSWGWVSTIEGVRPRGLPDSAVRPTMLNVGGWTNIPDVTGKTQLAGYGAWHCVERYVPRYVFFPMSGMNLAFRREITPLMYFGLMGHAIRDPETSWGVHRLGDIWCGLLAKKVCDHLGYQVHIGDPLVRHDRASNPHRNVELEAPGEAPNEWLWTVLRGLRLPASATTPVSAMQALGSMLEWALRDQPAPSPGYWAAWGRAVRVWATLFETDSPSPGVASP